VLRELQSVGVQFTVVGDAVMWSGGAGRMTAERLLALKSGKVEVIAAITQRTDEASPYGTTFDGTPKTWAGKIISLDQWRRLSEWEKHGPNGRHWNGKTRKWEMPE
jgi:hypothetical protein